MCLGIPMKVVEIENHIKAYAEVMGVKRAVYMELVPEARTGDYVLVHAGFAVEVMDPTEAKERIKLFEAILKEEQEI